MAHCCDFITKFAQSVSDVVGLNILSNLGHGMKRLDRYYLESELDKRAAKIGGCYLMENCSPMASRTICLALVDRQLGSGKKAKFSFESIDFYYIYQRLPPKIKTELSLLFGTDVTEKVMSPQSFMEAVCRIGLDHMIIDQFGDFEFDGIF